MNAERAVSVIIPTLGLRERAASLRAAIASVESQTGVSTTVIVVLNGPKRDPGVERELKDNVRITLVVRDAGGIPSALAAGRAQVKTPWFATLDDDDLYLAPLHRGDLGDATSVRHDARVRPIGNDHLGRPP